MIPMLPSGETFWAAIGLLILIAIVVAVVNKRRRDRVLRMFNKYNVSLQRTDGNVVWGSLRVCPQGLEIGFISPSPVGRYIKHSYLLHEQESNDILAIARWDGAISGKQIHKRFKQIKSRVKPNKLWLLWRCLCNWFNTFRDVFGKLFSMIVGQIAKQRPSASIIGQESTDRVKQWKAQNYEPLLERHLGKLVVVEIKIPTPDGPQCVEYSGYLGEYSESYIILLNTDQAYERSINITDKTMEGRSVLVEYEDDHLCITNPTEKSIIIEEINNSKHGIVLIPGSYAKIRCSKKFKARLSVREGVDLIISRHFATVRHGLM
jgi:hypothetical protein